MSGLEPALKSTLVGFEHGNNNLFRSDPSATPRFIYRVRRNSRAVGTISAMSELFRCPFGHGYS